MTPGRIMAFVVCGGLLAAAQGLADETIGAAPPLSAAIVVALDRSQSVTPDEATAQIDSLIGVFSDPSFRRAAMAQGGIAITVICWSSFAKVEQPLPWTAVRAEADFETAIAVLTLNGGAAYPDFHGSQTDLSLALSAASDAFTSMPFAVERQIVNLVADDIANIGELPEIGRDRLLAEGSTVNALTMVRGKAVAPMADYYRRRVIGGPDAFVHAVAESGSWRDAMRRKFMLEVAGIDLLDLAVSRP